ncbi:MAG: hypothetical protein ACXABY_19340 [Candidatus Thorarchaeota archaeon]|jgi:hypothetical protein
MGLKDKSQLITTGREADRLSKLAVDVIAQAKGVFRSVLSPHYKTGLVSRSIRSEVGQIETRFLNWDMMKEMASMEYVALEIQSEPQAVVSTPGVLTADHLTTMAQNLTGDVFTVAKFSPPDASELIPEQFDKYTSRYALAVEKATQKALIERVKNSKDESKRS